MHRMVGNRIEAGRWTYLHADADPAETAAFERAYPSATQRRRKVRWPADGQAATEFARQRLAALTGPPPPTRRPSGRRLVTIALALATPLAVLGAVTLVQWLVG